MKFSGRTTALPEISEESRRNLKLKDFEVLANEADIEECWTTTPGKKTLSFIVGKPDTDTSKPRQNFDSTFIVFRLDLRKINMCTCLMQSRATILLFLLPSLKRTAN